jgi:ABC-type branched-subunit amino acid transport system ATPase component
MTVREPYEGAAVGDAVGGEPQPLALARCLCGSPKLILLDEPTEDVQPSIVDEIIETLPSCAIPRR